MTSPFAQGYFDDYTEYEEDPIDIDGLQKERLIELEKLVSEFKVETEYQKLIRRILENMYKLGSSAAMTSLSDECKKLLKEKLLPACRGKHDNLLLKELSNSWSIHKELVRAVGRVYAQLGGSYEASSADFKKVEVNIFRDMVYEEFKVKVWDEEFKVKVWDTVFSLIDEDLRGAYSDHEVIKGLVDMSVELELGCYVKDFETRLLQKTKTFYTEKASKWIMQDSLLDYMKKVECSLNWLNENVSLYVHDSSKPKLFEEITRLLIPVDENRLKRLYDPVYDPLLKDIKPEYVAWMYRLLSDIPQGLQFLSCVVKQHIIAEVTPSLKTAEDMENNNQAKRRDVLNFHRVLMLELIDLHNKHLKYSNDCGNSKDLDRALGKAYEVIFNRVVTTSFSAQFLSSVCDDFIKDDELSDDAIRATLENVLGFVSYVENKFLFAELYRGKLARTLLSRRSGNVKHHRDFLTLLEMHLGSSYTSKMKKMVDDVTLAEKAHQSFNDYLSKNPNVNLGIDFRVTMLNNESWPTQEYYDLNLPDEMVKCLEVHKEFYRETHAGKKVNWIFSLGTCDIVGRFDSGPIELEMTTIQACVLMLYNSSTKLSYEEIKN